MLEAAASVLVAALAAPYLLPLHRVSPRLASRVWLAALGLRAAVGIGVATVILVGLPQTEIFTAFARSSWHQVIPVIATHVDWRGHPLAHAAAFLPSLQLALSLLVGAAGGVPAVIGLRRMVSRSVGTGPLGSIVVADERVLIGVPAMGPAQIFVSDSALAQLEDELGGESQIALRLDQLLAGGETRACGAIEGCAVAVAASLTLSAVGSTVALGLWLGPELGGLASAIACA